MRDTQLDSYRALMMMYVIFCHAMFWLRDVGEPWLSVVLFAMAGTFFIAGASVSVRPRRRGLWSTVLSRVERVVVPFYIYAAVIIVFSAAVTALAGDTSQLGFKPFSLAQYGWRDVVKILLLQDVPGTPYPTHIWFLQPYLILSCTFPLQEKLMVRCNRHLYLAACFILFVVMQCVTHHELLREVACYNVFMVAGYLYYKRADVALRVAVGLCAAAAIVAYVAMGGHFCPMQSHKFPPDWLFATYGVFALCMVSLVLGRIRIPANKLLAIWNTRGFNIYLYQSMVFVAVGMFSIRLRAHVATPAVWLAADSVQAIVLATALSFVTYPLEQTVLKAWRKAI